MFLNSFTIVGLDSTAEKDIFISGFLPDDMFIFVSVSSIFNIYIYCEAIYFRRIGFQTLCFVQLYTEKLF